MPIALITGSAKRIGREIALHMAKDGWDIAIHYHQSATEAEATAQEVIALGQQAFTIQANLNNTQEAQALLPAINKEFGQVLCLIHNASLFEKDSIYHMELESLESHLNINFVSPIILSSAFATQLPDSEEGNIIYLVDGMKNWSISPTFFSYSASKIALEANTHLLAQSLSPNIRVNTIAPGATLEGKNDKEHTFNKIKTISPLNKTGQPSDICDAIDYLLKAQHVTGQTINLSAGMNIL